MKNENSARYKRQMIMPEIGPEGQERLKKAIVFLGGLGGLGSIIANYLAAAGVGNLRIADMDRVEESNLNRQILHWTDDIGTFKSYSAEEKLRRLNPECRIEAFVEEIKDDTIVDLVGNASVIVDGLDNLQSRKVLNRTSLKMGIPYVFGGVEGFNGMVTTFIPGKTPCLECLFPFPAPSEKKELGIIGPVAGFVASLQALETIKIILGLPGLLIRRLLYVQGADMKFREMVMEKNADCGVCGPGGKKPSNGGN
jgi:molybdopterin/thiamine biosynthesis adenylyltransferase